MKARVRMVPDLGLRTERVKGIEPSLSAWEADVLPLNYTRERHHSTRHPGPAASPLRSRQTSYVTPAGPYSPSPGPYWWTSARIAAANGGWAAANSDQEAMTQLYRTYVRDR